MQLVYSRTIPRLCNEAQLKEYLDRMNNETFLSSGGYQFFAHETPLPNLNPSYRCHDLQTEDSDLLQDRSSCPWYYIYQKDPLRFPRFILNAYPKHGGCYANDNSLPRHCRDLINGGPNPNGVCEKFEIEVLTFRKKTVFDHCYTVEEKQNITLGFGCVYRRMQIGPSQRRNKYVNLT